MKNYTFYEIIKITPEYFDKEIRGNIYDFTLSNPILESEKLEFQGKMIDVDLSTDGEIFNFVVNILDAEKSVDISVLSLKFLKYISK